MRKLSKKSKAIIAGAVLVGLGTSGVAYSYWTSVTQAPAVSGTVGANGHTLTLSTSGTLPTTLGESQNITVSAQNVTHASQILAGLSASLTGTGCTVGDSTKDFTVTDHTSRVTVLAGTAVSQGFFTVTLNSLGVNQDACQGDAMTFTVTGS
jgi:hypothetical protein